MVYTPWVGAVHSIVIVPFASVVTAIEKLSPVAVSVITKAAGFFASLSPLLVTSAVSVNFEPDCCV